MTPVSIPVGLGARSYDVIVGAGVLSQIGQRLATLKPGAKVGVVSDTRIAALYAAPVQDSLARAGLVSAITTVAPGEQAKSFAGLESVCNALLGFGLDRRDCVVALGGGVIGDLAGLAAGLVKRGLDVVHIPTTLLAQVDSSVGGKTAIDTVHGKNMVGLFHQPRLVLADLETLATLPEREVRAGLAEVVKYGLIEDDAFFNWCVGAAAPLLRAAPPETQTAVAHSVRVKARIVAADERESGQRALLNLGHTFGHAIEAVSGMDGSVLHGEAVAIGMAMAFDVSQAFGLCAAEDCARVRAGLKALALPVDLPPSVRAAGVEAFLAAMAHDKKNESNRLTLILAEGVGRSFVMKDAPKDRLKAHLERTVF